MSGIGEKIAKKYAKALFESFDENRLEAVESALKNLADIWTADETIRAALLSPTVIASERNDALLQVGKLVAQSNNVEPADHLSRFLVLLEGNGRIAGIPEVAKAFSELLSEARNEKRITIVSASPLNEDEKSQILSSVKEAAASSALSQVEWTVDSSILGGVIIRTADKEIDGSVRGALDDARASLLSS